MDHQISQKFKFSYPLKVRYAETDAQGHVFFGNYYTYFDESLLAYMRAIGYGYQDLLADGMDLLYLESHCHHYAPAYFGDVLNVHARLGSIGNTSLTFEFSAYRDGSDQLLATGYIIAVNVDGETRQPRPVPAALRNAVAAYES